VLPKNVYNCQKTQTVGLKIIKGSQYHRVTSRSLIGYDGFNFSHYSL